jgi:anti-sigma factor RsiW
MHCEAASKLISRYLDNELSPQDRASLDLHLAQCSGCQAELAAQQKLWAFLVRVEPIQSPNLILAVEAQLSKPRGWAALLARLQLPSMGYAAAAALLVGVFVLSGVWAGSRLHGSTEGEHDRAVVDLLTDTPPGMEVVTVLEKMGERR